MKQRILHDFSNYWFYITLLLYIFVGVYVLAIAYIHPFVPIELKQENGKWLVEAPYFTEWAAEQGVNVGDQMTQVNGQPISTITHLQHDSFIYSANTITIAQQNGQTRDIQVRHADLPYQFYMHAVIPSLYFLITLWTAIYLYRFKNKNELLQLLILFLLVMSIAYISAGASSRRNEFAGIIIQSTMILCLVILIHFLKKYFTFLQLKWSFIRNMGILYTLPILMCIFSILAVYSQTLDAVIPSLTLASFSVLLFTVLAILLQGYFRSKYQQLKVLLVCLVVPFLPFVLLFVLPNIIFQQSILSSDISALFFLFIPFSFIFTQVTERLFGFQYHLSRIRYYGRLSLITAFVLSVIFSFVWREEFTVEKIAMQFVMSAIAIFTLLYIKEKVDFRQRKILFTTHADSIHGVYSVIQRIGQAVHQEQMLEILQQEITQKLEFNVISISFLAVEPIPIQLGEVKKKHSHYDLLLHSTPSQQVLLSIGSSAQPVHLKEEEIIWLELIAVYCDSFLHSFKRIEELVREMKDIQPFPTDSIPWLDKLVWQFVEKEKVILAQELHDTILQEQLYLARELDVQMHEVTASTIEQIRDQLLDISYQLREYCENLSPPLLDTLGLQTALKKLMQKVKMRSNFMLHETIEELAITDPAYPLMIYRLIQELLNNALKHSEASVVSLQLLAIPHGFEIHYEDNGIGFNMNELISTDSMGLKGMFERVRAFNGKMAIDTKKGNGLKMTIKIIEESGVLNESTNRG